MGISDPGSFTIVLCRRGQEWSFLVPGTPTCVRDTTETEDPLRPLSQVIPSRSGRHQVLGLYGSDPVLSGRSSLPSPSPSRPVVDPEQLTGPLKVYTGVLRPVSVSPRSESSGCRPETFSSGGVKLGYQLYSKTFRSMRELE